MSSDAAAPSSAYARRRRLAAVVLVLVTLVSGWAIAGRLRLDPNVASLLPARGEAASLRRYLQAFGGTDLAVVLVKGSSPAEVEQVTGELAAKLEALPSVDSAAERLRAPTALPDPMLAWRHADAGARERLRQALTPEGMRKRLKATRTMLLAPGGGEASARIAKDPLRLNQLVFESGSIKSAWRAQADGAFATDDGLARLVLVHPAGQALKQRDAKVFVGDAEAVLEEARKAHPSLTIGLTGGHAIAAATERMLTRDLSISGTASLLLAALAFALTFRRLRALVAVMPPLMLGTLWTAGLASLLPSGLSAIAVAFMSVVVGVGVDTGVHVYTALLEARREGLAPEDAARVARQKTQRPVLVAALTAGAAFASLALSEISALRQLGILCAGGEILTAFAIVAITPEIGARLERGDPPEARVPAWTQWVARMTGTRDRARAVLIVMLVPLIALALGFGPKVGGAIVALRPAGLEPLQVQQQVYDAFGGRPGQWVVMIADRDEDAARARGDRVAEALAALGTDVDSVDALTAIVPATATQKARFAERDALGMADASKRLRAALVDVGFATDPFEGALRNMANPGDEVAPLASLTKSTTGRVMLSRYVGRDAGDAIVVLYVLPHPTDAARARVEKAIHAADGEAMITGYGRLEGALKASLERDMPTIGLVAAILVALALSLALRRAREVALATAVVVVEMAAVLLLIRVIGVPLHAYDALVLPVLLGITVDEGMFLLYRAREAKDDPNRIARTLGAEGPPVATTALTTAAGFGALVICDFDGLRHLGAVGSMGSIVGLGVALVLVPAGLRLQRRRA